MGWVIRRITNRYPVLEAELDILIDRFPQLGTLRLFLNTLWAILDSCPQAFARPLPPIEGDDTHYLQALTYLKNRESLAEIVGWLAAYEQHMHEQTLRFAGALHWPEMSRQSLYLLVRCAQRVAEYERTQTRTRQSLAVKRPR